MSVREETEGVQYCSICKVEQSRPYYDGKCEDCYLDGLQSITERMGSAGPKVLGARQDASRRGGGNPTFNIGRD